MVGWSYGQFYLRGSDWVPFDRVAPRVDAGRDRDEEWKRRRRIIWNTAFIIVVALVIAAAVGGGVIAVVIVAPFAGAILSLLRQPDRNR